MNEEQKKVVFPTNINGKLVCSAMVHVSAPPVGNVYESILAQAVIEIHTADNSCPPTTWKLDDICRLKFCELQNCFTWPSHGVDVFDFYKYFMIEHPEVNSETPMAVYFYHKIL